MDAKYLLRFDDICPTMDWRIWTEIEKMLIAFRLRPMLAVVPDNRDPQLHRAPPHPDFWGEVRRWQDWGWAIGLHGYQHRYVTREPGVLGLNARSEFAGLPATAQEEKIQNALAIFARERVQPRLWIAPAHSFDQDTLTILRRHAIDVVSDGFFIFPHRDGQGTFWIPQQMWRFRRMPFGVWTICLHHNQWQAEAFKRFGQSLENFKDKMTAVNEVVAEFGGRHVHGIEKIGAKMMLAALQAKRRLFKRGGEPAA